MVYRGKGSGTVHLHQDFLPFSHLPCFVSIPAQAVWPGEFGIPQPFYFPFTREYWLGTKRKGSEPLSVAPLPANSTSEETPDLPKGLQIRNLVKVYAAGDCDFRRQSKRQRAVDDLSLDLCEGQITSLLGHNGAGKTTTMSIITGLFPPTSGQV